MTRKMFLICLITFFMLEVMSWADPIDWETVQMSAFQFGEENNPIGRYLWVVIRYVCYGLGGVAGAAGMIFGIFGFWVGRGPIIKQGLISAIAGFAFVLVIPMVRIIFSEWVDFIDVEPYIPALIQFPFWRW